MKIRIVNVIPGTEYNEYPIEQAAHFKAPDVDIDVTSLDKGPPDIQGHYDENLAAIGIMKQVVKAEKDGVDGIFINCFGEPAVKASRELVRIPVVGGFEAAVFTANMLADQWSIVTIIPSVVPIIRSEIKNTGVGDRVRSIRDINTPFTEFHEESLVEERLLKQIELAVVEDGAEAIVMGCTGFGLEMTKRLENHMAQKGNAIPIVNSFSASLCLLDMLIRNQLCHSLLTYHKPPERPDYY